MFITSPAIFTYVIATLAGCQNSRLVSFRGNP
jgi:hypothetical protein